MKRDILTKLVIITLVSIFLMPANAMAARMVELELWTFVNTHARFFRTVAEDFMKIHPNVKIDVQEIEGGVLWDKLQLALATGMGAPDMVDIEQGAFGRFIKGDIQLEPLNSYLERSNNTDAIFEGRQALYTYKGNIYGLEHALCPVVMYYRTDILDEIGVEAPIETWEDWIAIGKKVVASKQGRFMAPIPEFQILLRQRGGDFFNSAGELIADNALSIDTLKWILATRDELKVTNDPPAGPGMWTAVQDGVYATLIGADWYAGWIKDNAPDTAGLWKAQPLPLWEDGVSNTSTHGGTGLTMTTFARDKELAWEFMEMAQLTKENAILRYQLTHLYPPLKAAVGAPELEGTDEFFGGQRIGALFGELGANVPPQYNTPFTANWNNIWGQRYWPEVVDKRLSPEEGLKKAADELRAEIEKAK